MVQATIQIDNAYLYGAAAGIAIGYLIFTRGGRGAISSVGRKAGKGLASL